MPKLIIYTPLAEVLYTLADIPEGVADTVRSAVRQRWPVEVTDPVSGAQLLIPFHAVVAVEVRP